MIKGFFCTEKLALSSKILRILTISGVVGRSTEGQAVLVWHRHAANLKS